jgi:hypothetical protein
MPDSACKSCERCAQSTALLLLQLKETFPWGAMSGRKYGHAAGGLKGRGWSRLAEFSRMECMYLKFELKMDVTLLRAGGIRTFKVLENHHRIPRAVSKCHLTQRGKMLRRKWREMHGGILRAWWPEDIISGHSFRPRPGYHRFLIPHNIMHRSHHNLTVLSVHAILTYTLSFADSKPKLEHPDLQSQRGNLTPCI